MNKTIIATLIEQANYAGTIEKGLSTAPVLERDQEKLLNELSHMRVALSNLADTMVVRPVEQFKLHCEGGAMDENYEINASAFRTACLRYFHSLARERGVDLRSKRQREERDEREEALFDASLAVIVEGWDHPYDGGDMVDEEEDVSVETCKKAVDALHSEGLHFSRFPGMAWLLDKRVTTFKQYLVSYKAYCPKHHVDFVDELVKEITSFTEQRKHCPIEVGAAPNQNKVLEFLRAWYHEPLKGLTETRKERIVSRVSDQAFGWVKLNLSAYKRMAEFTMDPSKSGEIQKLVSKVLYSLNASSLLLMAYGPEFNHAIQAYRSSREFLAKQRRTSLETRALHIARLEEERDQLKFEKEMAEFEALLNKRRAELRKELVQLQADEVEVEPKVELMPKPEVKVEEPKPKAETKAKSKSKPKGKAVEVKTPANATALSMALNLARAGVKH